VPAACARPRSAFLEPARTEGAPVESARPETAARAYRCDGDLRVTATYDAATDSLALALPDGTVRLAHVVSASGARYHDDKVSFWQKGDEAMLDAGDGVTRHCVRALP
jgi:membrane-bound inhibitor of C-type lysozyme